MKIIEITTKMSCDYMIKNEFPDCFMKEKEYRAQQDLFLKLKEAIDDGLESGIAEDFNPELHLESLRRNYKNV